MYRKSTLRKLSPTTRKVARLLNEAEITILRLKKLLPLIESMEIAETAMLKSTQVKKQGKVTLGMTSLEDGEELFPGGINLAVRQSENRLIAKHRDCSFCNETKGSDECSLCPFGAKEKAL